METLVTGVPASEVERVAALRALLFPQGQPGEISLDEVLAAVARSQPRLAAAGELTPGARAQLWDACMEAGVNGVRGALLRVRSLLEAAHGPAAVQACGVAQRPPEQLEALVAHARAAASALTRRAGDYGAPAPFATLDLEGAARYLREHVATLCFLERARATEGEQRETPKLFVLTQPAD
ncbi:hypothetical protein [Haliangium ochraceum]|uniref:hypothetical protein n=1 Tax=Haliangium ochraceum TaxID=80816 RepID=UPI00019BAF57|nr:hypothetical protein [Haliangium ochraceum]